MHEGEHEARELRDVELMRERDEGGDDRGARRAGQALEVTLVLCRRRAS